jgi:hypothetical protein
MSRMYAHHIREFARQCCARIAAGESLPDEEAAAWAVLLEARELGGGRLLGRFAGAEPSFDTYSGRCGLPVYVRPADTVRL